MSEEEGIESEAKYHGKFRRHSTAVFSGKMNGLNGVHRRPVELYLIRINPACRIIWFYALQHNIPHILIDVDFSKGEANLPESIRKHPHREVPILIDGDFLIFEAPAILTYLATNYTDFAGYGITLQNRLLTESLISWANSELHRAVGHTYIYPQFLEQYALPSESANEVLVEFGLKLLSRQLEILEKKYLEKSQFLTGNRITVADSFVATILLQAEWSGTKFKMWPHVEKWLSRVKNQVHWDTVHMSHSMYLRELERCALFE
ncbi:glutathione S-transferase theta-3-like [Ruditapes philippinarum]|uniref:glutathione S-transferase theta-3-like n=1 Tax=Ruditapes philippinarum TaxID=129788 RepID=UPI00295C14F8|nr:glutathione S-transferase theta-3-like [Ruditapes philippinarum]